MSQTPERLRLVYTPRAYVFVKDRNNVIHDLSRYVVSGTINRLVDQVSTAEISFRNPDQIFTMHYKPGDSEANPGGISSQVFSPMDPITIYLRRKKNFPVRVFTGFLDKVPYLELFPGIVSITASCTLKRLMHTYFDPALPYTMSFLTEYGWLPYDGGWVSLTGMQQWTPPGTTEQASGSTTDTAGGKRIKALGTESKDVFLVGDSIAVGFKKKLKSSLGKDYTITGEGVTSQTTAKGIQKLKARGSDLPSTIVVALGSNDDVTDGDGFQAKIKEVMKIAGKDRHVIWVNLHGTVSTGSLSSLNAELQEADAKYPNLSVVKWGEFVDENKVKMDAQGVHAATANGYAKLAGLVSKSVTDGAMAGTGDNKGNELKKPQNIDGSLAELLHATMKHIANWDPTSIYIESMPEDLFDRMADLADSFADDNKEAQKEFAALLKQIGGEGERGSADGGGSTSEDVDVGDINGDVPEIVYRVGVRLNASPKLLLSSMMTGLVEAPIQGGRSFGNPVGGDLTGVPGSSPTRQSSGWRQETAASYPNVDRRNVNASAKRYFQEGQAIIDGKAQGKASTGSYRESWSAGNLAQAIQGSAYPAKYDAVRDLAKALLKKMKDKVEEEENSLGAETNLGELPDNASFSSRVEGITNGLGSEFDGNFNEVGGITTYRADVTVRAQRRPSATNTSETSVSTTQPKLYRPIDGPTTVGRGWREKSKGVIGVTNTSGSAHYHAGLDVACAGGTPCVAPYKGVISRAQDAWSDGGMVHFKFTEAVGSIPAGAIIGWGHVTNIRVRVGQKVEAGEVLALSGVPGGGAHVHFVRCNDESGGGDGQRDAKPIFEALQSKSSSGVDGGGSGGGTTNQQPAPEPKIDVKIDLSDYAGTRGGVKPKLIVLHSTEGNNVDGLQDLEDLANPILSEQGLSVHVGTDGEGNSARYVADGLSAKHCAGFNAETLGIEQIGKASQSSWPDAQIEATAAWVAYWSDKFDIPLEQGEVSGQSVKKPGVITHQQLGAVGGNHSDPGPAFPFDKVLSIASTLVKGGGGSGAETDDGSSGSAISQGGAGAFFASLDLPSVYDAAEAAMLGGEKSLLNDKPLLPFIQQLCSASLRHFQSLPDGRFYAFYPDYFGEFNKHPAYWEVEDVEILDGKIELTDENLVTHMYVVGDTMSPMANGATPNPIRSAFTSGVVTIFNAFMSDRLLDRDKSREANEQAAARAGGPSEGGFTQDNKNRKSGPGPGSMGILLDRNEAVRFLNRYGARPVTEDMPMIKNVYFEMFLAYQKFLLAWSQQFSTPFTFTFMPELFPGGKVAFPNHGLQMYIEQVTHTWNYESGFMTTASLSAPSAYGSNTDLLPANMVQAILEPTASDISSGKPTITNNTGTAQPTTGGGRAQPRE